MSATPPSQPGRYERIRRIATGGMGEVWAARDTRLNRDVAMKLLRQEYADDPASHERFVAEARNAASLRHPGIATVYDFGDLDEPDGARPFLVMELVDGQPLSALLRSGQPMPPEVARDLLTQAARALGVAHAAGMVHRDVKPANLLVTPDRHVKVTDFGIARAAGAATLTATGQVMGTPAYLSPEQAEGKPATPASDVYGLGAVLYACLAGHPPFTGDSAVAVAIQHLRDPVPDLPDSVPADLAEVTMRSLSKDPADRYPDADAFAAALSGSGSSATRTQRVVTPPVPVPADDSTRVMAAPRSTPTTPPPSRPTPRPATAPEPEPERRGLPPWWPIAGIALLAAILIVALVIGTRGDDDATTPQPTPSSTPSSPATTPSESPTPADTVSVDADDYLGEDVGRAEDELQGLNLKTKVTTRDNPGGEDEGTVADVDPTGDVEVGSVVTLTKWGAEPEPTPTPTPNPTPTPTPSPSPSPGASSTGGLGLIPDGGDG